MTTQHITILGAGNGGCAFAADLTLRGFSVTLFDLQQFEGTLQPIREQGGIQISGSVDGGFAALSHVTTDLAEALNSSDLIMIVVPAFAHAIFAKECAPHLRPGQTIVLNPGSTGGALEWVQIMRQAGTTDGITVAETSSLPYACRKIDPTHVKVFGVKTDLPIACFPARDTEALMTAVEGVYPAGVAAATNVLETSLNNLNAIAHPMVTLLNAGWIEATQGDITFYGEATTPSVARAMEVVDDERLAVVEALGLEPVSLLEWDQRLYGLEGDSLYEMLHNSKVHNTIKAPASLQDRYVTEDIPLGLVPIASIARTLGVPTPAMDVFINLAGILNVTDYWSEGRVVEKLGLAGLSAEQMSTFLSEGWSAAEGEQ